MRDFLNYISFAGLAIIFIALPFIVLTKGIWIPYRLQKSGEIKKEVVKKIDSHFHFFVPPLQDVYKITCKNHPDFEYAGPNWFLSTLRVGDTIYVFSNDKVKAGYFIQEDVEGFKPPTNIIVAMYCFRPFATVLSLILLALISFVFISCCFEAKKSIQADIEAKYAGQGNLSTWIKYSAFLNLFVYVFISVSFLFLIIKSAFLVEKSGPYMAGIVSLLGTSIGVSSPIWLYRIKKFWDSDKIVLFFIKSIVLFSIGLYSSIKLVKFISKEDLSTFDNVIELVLYFFENMF